MQQAATAASSPDSSSFAGLLAELSDPKPAPGKKIHPARDFDGLEDDVATLSYEHALRAHARYRPEQGPQGGAPQLETSSAHFANLAQGLEAAIAGPERPLLPPLETRRTASVTVRLSQDENDRLRQRAAEAGMTISAYLRSCSLEVEALRAQVKQTLAEMRQSNRQPEQLSLWNRFFQRKARRPRP